MKRLRVLVLLHPDLMPPESSKGYSEQDINTWKTEYDVVSTLRAAGHEVRPLGVHDELKPIRDEIEGWKPDVVFSLLEQFRGEVIYDHNVASYLELTRIPYTGCNPRGLMLARGKDLSKTLVHYHRIPVPAFAVFPVRRKVRRPARLALPLIVKSLSEDASYGISQASVVDSDDKLAERVAFIHERIGTAAIGRAHGPSPPRRSSTIRIIRSAAASCIRRPRISRPSCAPASSASPSASTARSSSTAMPASISASPPTALRISSRPIPIPRLRRVRNSRRPPCMTASPIPISCIASWRWE